jgi:hypothetical protein
VHARARFAKTPRMRLVVVPAALALCCATVLAQASKFDGAWNVRMTCPAHNASDDDAKGYTHVFAGRVVDGQFSGTYGAEGQPGWHFLRGAIDADGNATLRLDGMVNDPRYAIHDAPQGKLYSYRVRAHFEGDRGIGQRLTGRTCEFIFSR